ncbi:MAG: AAA family ATPase [Pseudomonadota bacterium]
MYEKFYGLSEKPFQIVPNPNFLYLSPKHQHALTYLEYGIREGMGFILLTGEIGTGKTTLVRHILNQLDKEVEVAVIFNTNVTADQLLCLLLREFELTSESHDKTRNLELIYQFLIEKYSRRRRVLLVIDEAQNLSEEALEEVRMLSNLQVDDNLLLQIMLVGQPELKAKLKRPGLAQLAQRIGVNYHLMPLNREETGAYIASRLKKVGGDPGLFSREAVDEIFRASLGTPRSINLLCDSSLVYGFADELKTIDVGTVAQVLVDKGDMFGAEAHAAPETAFSAPGELPVAEKKGGGLEQRLFSLEKAIDELRLQADQQHDELEKRVVAAKDELIRQLTAQLEQERVKYENLLREYGKLEERLKLFVSENGGKGFPRAKENGDDTLSSGKKTKKSSWLSLRF